MSLLFIINIALFLIGIGYIVRLAYFRLNKEKLVQKYRSGTFAYQTFQRDIRPIMLPAAIFGVLLLMAALVLTTKGMDQHFGNDAATMIQEGWLIAASTTAFLFVTAYLSFRGK